MSDAAPPSTEKPIVHPSLLLLLDIRVAMLTSALPEAETVTVTVGLLAVSFRSP